MNKKIKFKLKHKNTYLPITEKHDCLSQPRPGRSPFPWDQKGNFFLFWQDFSQD